MARSSRLLISVASRSRLGAAQHVCPTGRYSSMPPTILSHSLPLHRQTVLNFQQKNNNITKRFFLSDQEKADAQLDDLCKNHMDLPAQVFAMGCSFLHQVALGVPVDEVDTLLSKMPGLVNFRDYDRRTPLHIAASEGHLEICKLLLERGSKINRSDRWGGAPLDDAHRHKHIEVVQYLRLHGGKFGSASISNNLNSACWEGDVDEVRAILEYGNIDLNLSDYDQRTPLHLAASEGQAEIIQLLCEKGADANRKDRWGNRALDDAIAADNTACIKILKKFGGRRGSSQASSAGQEALLDMWHTYAKIRVNGIVVADDNGAPSERPKIKTMDWHDVQDMLRGIGEDPTDEVVRKLFEVADVCHNGIITIDDFLCHHETFLGGRPAGLILVVGGPGSGKGALSERLVKECGVVHLSSGQLLRDEVAQGTGKLFFSDEVRTKF